MASKIAFALGAGRIIGHDVSQTFASNGYKFTIVHCGFTLTRRLDLHRPESNHHRPMSPHVLSGQTAIGPVDHKNDKSSLSPNVLRHKAPCSAVRKPRPAGRLYSRVMQVRYKRGILSSSTGSSWIIRNLRDHVIDRRADGHTDGYKLNSEDIRQFPKSWSHFAIAGF
ncbi:hypothetical protein V1523DRAFT_399109 [Lipomyces doorenjongii]